MSREVTASFDGACWPNPGGAMGLGWVVDGKEFREGVQDHEHATNNTAEYLALIRCLDEAPRVGLDWGDTLTIKGDSQLVVDQVLGAAGCSAPHLQRLRDAVRDRMEETRADVELVWVPRSQNTRADVASKKALLDLGYTEPEYDPPEGYGNLTAIGRRLGVSAVRVGRLLFEAGMRDGKEPTLKALDCGIARERFNGFGRSVDWSTERCAALLQSAVSTS